MTGIPDSNQARTKTIEASTESLPSEPNLWNSVRVRFGLLLALALLPWLILTALEAYATYDRSRVSQTRLADVVAGNTVEEVGRTLEAGRLGLEAAPQIITELGCAEGAAEVIDRLGAYTALIVKEPDGIPSCQYPASLNDLILSDPEEFTPDKIFRIERGYLGDRESSRETIVVLQTFFRTSGRTYTLVLPDTLGLKEILDVTLGTDAVVALTKPDGSSILGTDTVPDKHEYFKSSITGDDTTFLDVQTDDGIKRRVASRYFDHLDLYVTVGRTVRFEGIRSMINPYTSVLLPILAWLIGFGLIWLGTQTMLLTPIAKVRRTARQFAGGSMESRVELSGSAAAEVHGLATSFNRMAHQLEERDSRIADNLDEKDTLMREIHHRVKNNLQIIISLLNMQERKADSQEAIDAINETRTRINAIAIVHRGLYESADLRGIDIGLFVARLIASLGDSLGTEELGITLTHTVEPCRVSADNAIPIALFIVEAVSNAVCHGVERGGKVAVDIDCPEEATLKIDVNDNGRGIGDPDSVRGIGTRLMKGFARQLSGTLQFRDNAPGLTVRLTLPIDDNPEQPFQVSRKRD